MANEMNAGQDLDPEVGGQPEPGSDDQPQDAAEDINLTRTWEGRVRVEQEKLSQIRSQLNAMGLDLDSDNKNIVVQQAPQYGTTGYYQPPAPEPPAEEETEYERELKTMMRQEAQATAGQMLRETFGVLMPVLEEVVASHTAQQVTDWSEIKDDVTDTCRKRGFPNLTVAKAQDPQFFALAVDAARGKKAASAPPPQPATTGGDARRQRIDAAAGVGGQAGVGGNAYEYDTAEDEALRQASGLTKEQYAAIAEGPVRIDV